MTNLKTKIKNWWNDEHAKIVFLKWLFVFTILSLFIPICLIDYGSTTSILFVKKLWIFLLFLPVPIISIILGVIYKKKGYKCKKNIIGGTIIALLLFSYGSIFFLYKDLKNRDYQYLINLGTKMNYQFPQKGEIASVYYQGDDLESIDLKSINYITFSKKDAEDLNEKISSTNTTWLASPTEELNPLVPEGLNLTEQNRILFYNATNNEINKTPSSNGTYEMYYFIYNLEYNYLAIVDYTTTSMNYK